MAFDGSIVAALCSEFNKKLCGGRIAKIVQPEKDELLLTVKSDSGQFRLLISVNPSLPVMYLTEENKAAPLQAPAFCMLLRKHLQSGKIISITQPSMERIIDFEIEHYNDMGDLCRKILTIELMGKHSNIIFRDGTKILDSIRHVSAMVSSVREVLPGRDYFIPFSEDRLDPHNISAEVFADTVCRGSLPVFKSIYTHITGFSPQLSEEAAYNAHIDSQRSSESLSPGECVALHRSFGHIMERITAEDFAPVIVYDNDIPTDFSAFPLNIYADLSSSGFESVSEMLRVYYASRQVSTSMKQKTTDLRQIVQTILSRDNKKLDLQTRQIKDTEKKDKFKTYGELLTAYGYDVEPKSTSYTTVDFYTGDEVTIPLDPTLSAVENGKRYFEKYSKLKRTFESLQSVMAETRFEIEHLESILVSLDTAANEADIADIRQEMSGAGYIKSRQTGKKGSGKAVKSEPLHYISSDGFDIYVGKNNYQNEYITFKLAEGGDWWFHAKKRPGSHVIVKCAGKDIPDRTFEEAARLAAYYSKSEGSGNIEIDYVQKKHVKKPGGGKPGFVIYHTNYSMSVPRDITGIKIIQAAR